MKLILFILLLAIPFSLACSCIESPPPEVALNQSSAVFRATVTKIQNPIFSTSSLDPQEITFTVHEVWKGDIQKTTILTTAQGGASCGYEFKLNQEYLIYSTNNEVSLCSRTTPTPTDDIQLLGNSTPPQDDEPQGLHPILRISLMGLGVLVAALLLLRYKK